MSAVDWPLAWIRGRKSSSEAALPPARMALATVWQTCASIQFGPVRGSTAWYAFHRSNSWPERASISSRDLPSDSARW